jgi:hypothetical protein
MIIKFYLNDFFTTKTANGTLLSPLPLQLKADCDQRHKENFDITTTSMQIENTCKYSVVPIKGIIKILYRMETRCQGEMKKNPPTFTTSNL